MTLKGHYALSSKRHASFGAHHENVNEDRLYCQPQRCSAMTLDSDNIRIVRLFPAVPWRGGVKRQWGNQKRRFQTLRLWHLRKWGQHYYIVLFISLSPFHWPQNTWPWMTLNGLNGHFTLYVHYYERPLTNYLLLIFCRLFITHDLTAENLRIFLGRYIVGTLKNNANIII